MNSFCKEITVFELCSLDFKGDFNLDIAQSSNEFDTVQSSHCEDNFFKILVTGNSISFVDTSVNNELLNDEFQSFKQSVIEEKGILSNIATFFSDTIRAKNNVANRKRTITIKLLLSDKTMNRKLKIKANNLNVSFENCALDDFDIDCGNLHFDNDGLLTKKLVIKSSNLRSNVKLIDDIEIDIAASNATLHFLQSDTFGGQIKVDGNNVKMFGDYNTKDTVFDGGSVSVVTNNGRIYFE